MNHPTHPEEVEFAGLVMGREAVTVSPVALTNEQIHAIIREQAALAAPVAAQPETSNLALQELTTLIRHHADPEAFQEIRQALLAFNQTAQPAVPVTDAECLTALKTKGAGPWSKDTVLEMRWLLEGFLASRGQA